MFRKLRAFIFAAVCALSLSNSYGVSVLLDGITAGDNRYNAKKLFDGSDDYLCWAFSASNAIEYWQDSKNAQGVQIPYGTPIGTPTDTYSSDITQTFVDNWINDGGEECDAFDWWFSGDIQMPDDSGGIDDDDSGLKPGATGGGYWLGTPYAEGIISDEFCFERTESDYYSLSGVIDDAVENGWALTCGIYTENGGAHAITLWGYEMDDLTQEVTGLWICDSDNDFTGNYMVDLAWNESELLWELGDSEACDYSTNEWYLGDISILMAGAAVPEPSAYAALFGIVTLIFAVWRKNRLKR